MRGDITLQDVDAIVNAANTALRPGGGVDGAITRAAGPDALAERERIVAERGPTPLPTGHAVATPAGRLSARWIVHTAGPVYSGRDLDRAQLRSCHVASIEVANGLGARTIAFPAISCGIYGYPPEEAAPLAIDAVMRSDTKVREVRFVLFDEDIADVFTNAMRVGAERLGWAVDPSGLFWSPRRR